MNAFITSIFFAALLFVPSAHAIFVTTGDAGVYFSGLYGLSNSSEPAFEDDKALRLGVGFELNKTLAVEVNYVDLGAYALKDGAALDGLAATIEQDVQETFPEARVDSVALDAITTGLELSLTGEYPLGGGFNVYGRAGLFHWNKTLEVDVVVVEGDSRGRLRMGESGDNGIDIVYGLGIAYRATQALSLNIEWSNYTAADADNQIAGVGARWYF